MSSLNKAKNFLKTGDLESRLGNPDGARKAYAEAEKLYKLEQNQLGQAHVLRGTGDLESILGNPDGARKAYAEAEKLDRQSDE